MDTTQQTIGQIVGDFTELAHDLHDQGVINEGKLKEYLGLVEDSTALMKDFKFRGRMINSLLFVAEQPTKQIMDLGGEPVEAPGELVAKVNARRRRHLASRGRRLRGVWANRLRA